MDKALVLLAIALGLAACRPASDKVDAAESGAVAAGGASGSGRSSGDPVARGAEMATPETLPTNAVVAEPGADPAEQQDALANAARASTANLPANVAEANSVAPVPAPTIPAEYRGNWGLVAADCTSTRGDAKGLIRIGERTVRFYESTATLMERLPAQAGRFSGAFSYTGEGQSWETVTSFSRQGDTLTRTEGAQGFSYTRCR